MKRWTPVVFASALLVGCAGQQQTVVPAVAPAPVAAADLARPIPYPVVPPPEYLAAVEAGTRTLTGAPGPRYWQNWTDYRLRARLLPDQKRLEGSAAILYHNRSPDTLRALVVDLAQNLHAPGVPRVEPAEVTGGIELGRVAVAGRDLPAGGAGVQGPRYIVQGTKMVIVPPAPVLPRDSVRLGIDWAFAIPQAGAGERMGHSGENLFFLAYWYPQMALYDDLRGWHPDPFLGRAEFHSGFGSYDLTVEAPVGWVVMGTGALANPAEVLPERVLERLRRAEGSDSVVHVLTPEDFPRATRTSGTGWLQWRFVSDTVRDVAFSATRESRWDAARAPVGDRDGDGRVDYTRVDAFWRTPAFRWAQAARYAQHSIDFLSRYTAYPYPWPHMTSVEGGGIIGGGMEFPMITLMGDYTERGDAALYYVTAHEFAHMWVPMIVGTDERRHAWFDEGITTFAENQARKEFFPAEENPDVVDRQSYIRFALTGMEQEMMRRGDFYYTSGSYVTASYPKPATVLVALRGLLGEETFLRAYRQFIEEWAFKHPEPWDMWNTFERVSGRELDWFWRSWYYESWLLDQAVAEVAVGPEETVVMVRDLGNAPMPTRLTLTRRGGEVIRREVPVETWLAGRRTATVTVPVGDVVRVEIDAENVFPDVNRENNVWVAGR